MVEGVTFRAPAAEDLPALNEIMQASSAYAGAYSDILRGYEITPAQLARDSFALAEREGVVAGFYSLTSGPPLELDLMFVDDRWQGMGLGARLFAHMAATARSLGATSVLIVSHPPSVGFYQRQGAVRTGEQPSSGRVTWARPVLRFYLAEANPAPRQHG